LSRGLAVRNGGVERFVRGRAGLAGSLLTLALLAGCGSEGPTPASYGPALMLVYCSNRPPSAPSNKDIYFYDVATGGTAFRPPNVDTPFDEGPAGISGDGRWLAYNTTNPLVGTASELAIDYVPSGSIHAPVTPSVYQGAFNPSLSYDGHYLAFQTVVGSIFEQDIVLMDAFADTVILTPKLHEIGALDFDPSLSGDGKLIAFTTTRYGTYDIALYDVAGDSLIPLPNCNSNLANDLGVSISRDGRRLAFHSNRAGGVGNFDVYVYDRPTSSLLPMPGANTPLGDINPALSPDGQWVAFTAEGEGGSDIRLYDLAARRLFAIPGANDSYFAERFVTIADIK
jgi:Tol biopolymer transport system component